MVRSDTLAVHPEPAARIRRSALSRPERLAFLAFYALASVVLVKLYTALTYWHKGDIALYWEQMQGTPWRYRLLAPSLAGFLSRVTDVSIETVYFTLAALSVFGALVFFQRLLACFVAEVPSRLLAPLLLHPLAWNYCLLNTIYTPFDLPEVLLATAGFFFLCRRNWIGLYVVVALGIINRESIFILIVAFAFVYFGRMERRRFSRHLAALLALFLVLKLALLVAVPGAHPALMSVALFNNLRTWTDMLLMRGHALKDYAKLILAFGSLWILVPFLYRGLPPVARRLVLIVIPYVVLLTFMGILDEMRSHAELVPVLTLPAAIALGRRLEGNRRPPDE